MHFFHDDQPTASLVVWAYAVSSEAMQHDVLLARESWMRFHDRSYRTLAPRPGNNQVLREVTLSLSGLHGGRYTIQSLFQTLRRTIEASTCFTRVTPGARFLAIIDSSTPIWFAVTVPRPGCYLVDMLARGS